MGGPIVADIFVHGIIGMGGFFDEGITANSVRSDLSAFASDEPIRVRVNSPGGDFGEAVAIRTLLSEREGPVSVQVDSRALSAATMLAPKGAEVLMAESSMLMVHEVWTGPLIGNAGELRQAADVAEKHTEVLADYYVDRTGLGYDEVMAMMQAETWMKANEAIEMGFADGMAEGVVAIAACAIPDTFRFRNVPKDYVDQQQRQVLHGKLSQQLAALRSV